MALKLAIIYYSQTGTTYQLAKTMAETAESKGADVRLRRVAELAPDAAIDQNPKWREHLEATQHIPEARPEDADWADALAFGSPTRFGLPTSQLKQYLDQLGGLWFQGKLANKVVTSFVSASTAHGGQESTLLAINNTFYHWGSIILGPGYLEPVQFQAGNPYGASFTSNNGQLAPDETAHQAAQYQIRRLLEVAGKWTGQAVSA
jgi:NAD(P)H dehydrogenase (quinone)